MEEKMNTKSICLPKSFIFVGGNGEKSVSVSEGIAKPHLEIQAKENDGGRKQTMLFYAVVFSQWLLPLSEYRREQMFLSSLTIREILGRKSAVGWRHPPDVGEREQHSRFFRVCACGWMETETYFQTTSNSF